MATERRTQAPRRGQSTMVLSGISKHYDGVAALTDVSLDIRPARSTPCSARTAPASRR